MSGDIVIKKVESGIKVTAKCKVCGEKIIFIFPDSKKGSSFSEIKTLLKDSDWVLGMGTVPYCPQHRTYESDMILEALKKSNEEIIEGLKKPRRECGTCANRHSCQHRYWTDYDHDNCSRYRFDPDYNRKKVQTMVLEVS